jgi:hypothetical protein
MRDRRMLGGGGMVEASKSGPHFGVGGYGRGSAVAWIPAAHMTEPFFGASRDFAVRSSVEVSPYFLLKNRKFCFATSVRPVVICPTPFALHNESDVRILHE